MCLKCNKNTESINPRGLKISNNKITLLSKCAICGSKKSRFIKEQGANGLVSSLSLKTPLSKILLLGDILFWMQFHWIIQNATLLKRISNIKRMK